MIQKEESAERHVRACTFLFILHEGIEQSREKKAELAEKPFLFGGRQFSQTSGLSFTRPFVGERRS